MNWRRLQAPSLTSGPAYVELVRMLYAAFTPLIVMGTATTVAAAFVTERSGDRVMGVLAVMAALTTVVRLWIIRTYRRERQLTPVESPEAALRWERIYAAGSFVFAMNLGAIVARAFFLDDPVSHMLVTGLLYAYAAGVISRTSVRPWICIGSLVLATFPVEVAILARWELAYVGHGVVMAIMLAGGIETIFHMHRTVAEQIAAKLKLERLARADTLTGLSNRLELEEKLQVTIDQAMAANRLLAVHFIDLDRFKEINDRFGHPAGDALLVEVARRLLGVLRADDIAARIGGDEFIIGQVNLTRRDGAELLAGRLMAVISAPYHIDGRELEIGASVGIAIAPIDGTDVQQLIRVADAALYDAKRGGRGRAVVA